MELRNSDALQVLFRNQLERMDGWLVSKWRCRDGSL
jgi:hypothetical protein